MSRNTAHRPGGASEAPPVADGQPGPAPPPRPHVIDPRAVYTVAAAAAALGLKKECLPREIRLGRLQARKRGGRYYILGARLLAWLETGEPHHRWPATGATPCACAADLAPGAKQ